MRETRIPTRGSSPLETTTTTRDRNLRGSHRRGRDGRGRTARGAVTASVVVAVYLLLLVTGLAIGRHMSLPNAPLNSAGGGINTVARGLLGYGDRSDFLVDYASAHALTHGENAYAVSAPLIQQVGPSWNIQTADPHPPTLLTVVLPTTLLSYHAALAAWELAMIFVLILTFYLVGVSPVYAIPLGLAISLTVPGAGGIANPVPIVGLGVAMAYRWQNCPVLAGLGVALAAIPKESGLVLAVAFLLAARLRAVGWTALWYGMAAVIPFAFDFHVWSRYFGAGIRAIEANAGRSDNSSLLLLGKSAGLPNVATLAMIGAAAGVVAVARRDLFWPAAWATVAALPIVWSYSELTFVPLAAWAVVRDPRRSAPLALLAFGLAIGAAPDNSWNKVAFPIVTTIMLILLVTARPDPEGELWLPSQYDPFRSWPTVHERALG